MDKNPGSRKNGGVRRPWHGWPAWLFMRDSPDKTVEVSGSLAHGLTQVAVFLGMIAALVGAGHLAAWLGGYETRQGLIAITMKTNAALCLTLVGVALMLLVPPEARRARRWAVRAGATLSLLVGLLTLVENLSGWNFGIDQLLAAETPGAMAVVSPNQMGIPASLSFTLIGLALLILSRRDHRGVRTAQALALAVCLIGLLPTIGFLYDAQEFYGIAQYTGIAWPTALTLLLLGVGLLCARPAEGLMAQVTADDPGGISIRRLLPAFAILPLLLGWLRLAGERAGVFDAATGTGIMMLVFIITFAALAYHAGRRASHSAQVLRESEERFRRYFELGLIGMAVTSPAKGMIEVNDECCRLLGYERDELLQKTWAELTHPDDLAADVTQFDRVLAGQIDGYAMDKRFVRKDGQVVDAIISVTAMRGADGAVDYFLALLQDITERKRAEEALRAKDAELELILTRTPFMLTRCSRDLHYRYVSRAYAEMIGRTPDQVAGKPILEIMGEEGFETVRPRVEAVLQGQPVEYEAPVRFQGVGSRLLRVTYVPDTDEQGHVVGWIASILDITERKRAEEALRESEQRLSLAQQIAHVGTFDWDIRTGVNVWTPELEALYGLPPGGFAKTQPAWEQLVHPQDRAEAERLVEQAFETGAPTEGQWRVVWPDGSVHWLAGRWQVFKDESGKPLRMTGVNIDITERKRAEETLRKWNETLENRVAQRTAELRNRTKQLQKLTLELSQAEERERRRIALLLHEDLQQQIAGARFHVNLLKGRAQDDRQRAEADRVDAMLKEAIEKSRSLSHDLSPAVLHMNDLAEVLQWLVNRVRTQHGLMAHVDVLGETTLHSEALALFLFRAAQEMLSNVVKHARVKEARIRVRRLGRYVCLSVSDQGRGFDPQELKETSGFGLLSLRERTELLGGRMKIESAAGKGSKFRIVVPDSPRSEDVVGVGPRAYPVSTTPGDDGGKEGNHGRLPLRVLLVDDHEIVRQGLVSLLQETSDVVVVGQAADGREAVNLTSELRPDVVIMDVSMPLMSGDEATRQIKTYLPQTRVLALSMYDEADKKERMYQAGAEGYVLKTASAEELLAAIRGAPLRPQEASGE